MGLDMYLITKEKGINPRGTDGDTVCYWRKCNQIREWFNRHLEEGVENCEYAQVSKKNLEDLIADCYKVLDNHDLAEEIMPTSSGFFFGSTEYDDWYFGDLENTVNQLMKAFAQIDWSNQDVYYYEWW